jgi:hypothetical protein
MRQGLPSPPRPLRPISSERRHFWFGYTHFTLKGLAKVRTEWSLITLSYNLKRVMNLVSLEKLLAAVA